MAAAWLRLSQTEPYRIGPDQSAGIAGILQPVGCWPNSSSGLETQGNLNEGSVCAGPKKFSEFCGNSREVAARSPLEDPGVLIPLPPRTSDLIRSGLSI